MAIRVSIVEDDDRVCTSLARLLDGAPGFRCLQAYRTGEMALRMIPRQKPDVVLMDIRLAQTLGGIECLRKLKALDPALLVVMLTAYDDDELIFQALKAGANGYLLKPTTPVELLAAIRDVHAGGAPMSSTIARKVLQSFRQSEPTSSPTEERLSPRASEILDLLASGYMNKEIADLLGIGYETVCTHVRSVYRKLQVQSRPQAIFKYIKRQ